MTSLTNRLALKQPQGADDPSSIRTSIASNTTILDRAAIYQEGTMAARPAATSVVAGTIYRATDAAAAFVSDATVWHFIPLDGNSQPVGSVISFAGTSDPTDTDGITRWLIADGRSLPSSSYAALYSRIGLAYGGNTTNFKLPDLRGRVAIGPDNSPAMGFAGRLYSRTISGTANGNGVGSVGGRQDETLNNNELPAHTHVVAVGISGSAAGNTTGISATSTNATGITGTSNATADGLGRHFPASSGTNAWAYSNNIPNDGGGLGYPFNFGGGDSSLNHNHGISDPAHAHSIGDPGHGHSVSGTGSGLTDNGTCAGLAHNVMNPYQCLHYIIKVL